VPRRRSGRGDRVTPVGGFSLHAKLLPVCNEDNGQVMIGGEHYYLSGEGFLMPVRKGQPPPDLRYFKQPQRRPNSTSIRSTAARD
jgi:hypothetical protein